MESSIEQLDISELVNEVLLDDHATIQSQQHENYDTSDPRNVFKTLPQQDDGGYGSMPRQMKKREGSRDSAKGSRNSVANKSTISYSNKTKEKSRSGSRNRVKSRQGSSNLAPTMSFGEK